MLRLPSQGPRGSSGVQLWRAEIVSPAEEEVSCEFAPAFSSCRGWWHLRARFVFARAENVEARFGERSARDESPAPRRDEFLQGLRGLSHAGCARARSPLGRQPYEPPRFACTFRILPANGNSRSALAAPRLRDWPARSWPFLQRKRMQSETPAHASPPASRRIFRPRPKLSRATCD